MTKYAVLRIDSYEGDDTHIRCGNGQQDFLYAVVRIEDSGVIEIIDGGYLSFAEAVNAWPNAAGKDQVLEVDD